WGSLDAASIAGRIYDFTQDSQKSRVNYSPLLAQAYDGTEASLPQGPANPQIIINDGQALTSSRNLSLTTSASATAGSTVTEMRITQDVQELIGSEEGYQAYQTSQSVQLPEQIGTYYLYAQFRDSALETSAIAFSTIDYLPPNILKDTIDQDRTLGLNHSPYTVVSDLVISNGVTLTIEAGVEIEFDGVYRIEVNGSLIAEGQAEQRITFTRSDSREGSWIGIEFKSGSNQGRISYCDFSHSQTTISGGNAVSQLTHSTFSHISAPGIISLNSATVEDNQFNLTPGNPSLVLTINGGSVRRNSFVGGANGIAASGTVVVEDNNLTNLSGSGIRISTAGNQMRIENNNLSNCGVGISLSVDGGSGQVRYNNIDGCSTGVVLEGGNQASSLAGWQVAYNNLTSSSQYAVRCENNRQTISEIDLGLNWWGSLDAASIAGGIYDFTQDSQKSRVNYSPLLA
ncbi:TPA: right-handed parallel beta-helix repeat-containing protein, partial [Candidatus Poribacteria bacterium]|nr:right-handed parallel beta-helix repeat-containing protein [Candidatus Poribacteria bacterium]